MNVEITPQAVSNAVRSQGMEPTVDAESGQVVFYISHEDTKCPVFIRIYPEGQLVQIMLFFPMMMQPESQADTARLLHFFNKELDIPGFGMDESTGVCFFRAMIPVYERKIPAPIFNGYLETIKTVCKNFFSSIGVITTRTMTFEGLMSMVSEKNKLKEN